jgi:hypothetical protein
MNLNKEEVNNKYEMTTKQMNASRALTPNSGAYWNESDYFEPEWEKSFWGLENYQRLK